jgi:hypothetical protein
MTGEQRQTLQEAIERVSLWDVLTAYKKQYKATVAVYKQRRTSLPVGMWPQQKAPGARPPPKPAAQPSKPPKAAYHDIVRRLEREAASHQNLNTLRVELSTAQQSEQDAADSLEEQVDKRDIQQQQGRDYQHLHRSVITEYMYWSGFPVQAMDQGVIAAQIHHKRSKEAVKRGKFAEKAFLAQRDVTTAKKELQLYKQQLRVPASATGNVLHSCDSCG